MRIYGAGIRSNRAFTPKKPTQPAGLNQWCPGASEDVPEGGRRVSPARGILEDRRSVSSVRSVSNKVMTVDKPRNRVENDRFLNISNIYSKESH